MISPDNTLMLPCYHFKNDKVPIGEEGVDLALLPINTAINPDTVPKRLRASTIDHRSAAQYGQNSAPM